MSYRITIEKIQVVEYETTETVQLFTDAIQKERREEWKKRHGDDYWRISAERKDPEPVQFERQPRATTRENTTTVYKQEVDELDLRKVILAINPETPVYYVPQGVEVKLP